MYVCMYVFFFWRGVGGDLKLKQKGILKQFNCIADFVLYERISIPVITNYLVSRFLMFSNFDVIEK